MHRVSSNSTLFFKFFVPVFYIVLFGAVTTTLFFTNSPYFFGIPAVVFKSIVALVYLGGLLLLANSFLRLKRVELGEDFAYVTNYFKHVRYPYQNVRRIELKRRLGLPIGYLTLYEPGSFGQRIFFVGSRYRLDAFFEERPELRPIYAPKKR